MNREEYLYTLYQCLAALSAEERAAAMQYYTEYFDDAGPENEQQVIKELGPPQGVAKQILKDFAADRYPAPGYRPGPRGRRPSLAWWMVPLAILLLPAAIVLLTIAFSLALTVIILLATLGIVIAALIAAGIASILAVPFGFSGWPFFTYRYLSLGEALISLGLGLMLIPLCFWIWRQGLPSLLQKGKALFQQLRR